MEKTLIFSVTGKPPQPTRLPENSDCVPISIRIFNFLTHKLFGKHKSNDLLLCKKLLMLNQIQ